MLRQKETLKMVMVGHVDHGKSTLIGRLLFETHCLPKNKLQEIEYISKELGKELELAFLIDHLKEERQKAMTLDSAQLFFKSKKRNYVIIDAPGHVELTKNMLTGATQADIALLIIDANEGIQEQTRRHTYLLSLFGITQFITLLNKMDLVHYDSLKFQALKEKSEKFLKAIGLTSSCFIPISAKKGENITAKSSHMPWFKGPTLLHALDQISLKKEDEKPLRFPIQDIYDRDGQKIMVGKIASGHIHCGQKVMLLPMQNESKIKEIKVFNQKKKRAFKDECIGVIVDTPLRLKRGDMISELSSMPFITHQFEGNLYWMSNTPLKIHSSFLLKSSTQSIRGNVRIIKNKINTSTLDVIDQHSEELHPHEAALVTFHLEKPLIYDSFSAISETGRFVIEQDHDILGAGIIDRPLTLK